MTQGSAHGEYLLNGYLVWFVLALIVLALMGAVYILIDARRRPAGAFGRMPRVGWIAVAAVYLGIAAFGVAGWLLRFAEVLGGGFGLFFGLLTVIVLPTEVVYLLGIAFPKDDEVSADMAEDSSGGCEGPTGSTR